MKHELPSLPQHAALLLEEYGETTGRTLHPLEKQMLHARGGGRLAVDKFRRGFRKLSRLVRRQLAQW